jgi:hypothetical protein
MTLLLWNKISARVYLLLENISIEIRPPALEKASNVPQRGWALTSLFVPRQTRARTTSQKRIQATPSIPVSEQTEHKEHNFYL